MPELNLDTAFNLPITGIYEGHSFEIEFLRFADDGTTPENWTPATYTMGIALKESGPALLTFATGTGITRTGNLLKVTCLKEQNILIGKKKYFYDLYSDLGGGMTRPEGRGTITVNYSISR